eukprot:CAMPEP_0180002692 /NCGR_PEP_ID=MMETSP0984-20121128/11085_1 /TAXON_ID=483367 /ORGANISM="non described non described, Strain CCMP 2436" /LENGTH=33 /DNA_ID= /DNA_START= /DNA_END= /DNA_ORIENTATION=
MVILLTSENPASYTEGTWIPAAPRLEVGPLGCE